ncbi:TetR/AcrR family transcriptional regulator [Kribbella sancticallisti]|uniref:TetR/AcrR family transcriptional regulator n=1 Tax=Kribbella sancticallisti TaxID=460087 RepID=A0ABP4QF74_9ACTN
MTPAGRPKSETARQAVLAAALELVVEKGYQALTIEGIAERAGVAKTTIYRSWPGKAAVVMDAVLSESNPRLTFPDTGSAREDLRLQVSRVVRLFTEPSFAKPFVGLLAASQHDETLADTLHEWLVKTRRAGAAEVLRRGVERGELRADLNIPIAIDALYGALYYRLLVSHEPLSPQYAERVVSEVFAGLQASKNSVSTGASTSGGTT